MDVPGIDLDALLHDYHYGVCNAGVNKNEMASWLLAKGGETKRQRFLQFLQQVCWAYYSYYLHLIRILKEEELQSHRN
jgi:hypothetical protein